MFPRHILRVLVLMIFLTSCSTGLNLSPSTGTPIIDAEPQASPSPSASPTVTSTPSPQVRVSAGDQALVNGEYQRARFEYQSALAGSTEAEVQAAALWGLGLAEFLDGFADLAILDLTSLIERFPDSIPARRAHFLIGRCYDSLKRYSEAAEAYGKYLQQNPGVIDAYAQEIRGDALQNTPDAGAALQAYQSSLQAERVGDRLPVELKMASLSTSLGETNSSLAIYNGIAEKTSNDYVKAQMDLLRGQIYLNLGQTDQAYPLFQHAVSNYPLAYDSYSALVALVEAGIPVDEYERGLVDYFAGQYGVAIAAFNRYLLDQPAHDGTVLHYLALSYRENGDYQNAIQAWSELISGYPENKNWESAWDERADTQWAYMEDFRAAIQGLMEYVTKYPQNQNAAYYLFKAGRIQERNGEQAAAASTWERVASEYPSSEQAVEANFNAGIEHYRMGDYPGAITIFQKDLVLSSLPGNQARAAFWIAKSQLAKGETATAQQSLQMAAGLDPSGYYSERARNLLEGNPAFYPPPNYDLGYDVQSERNQAETWLRITFKLPAGTDLSSPGEVGNDPRYKRGIELWALGMKDEARLEFEDLRASLSEDAINSYRLANSMLEIGQYRIATESVRQMLRLAGMETYSQMLAAPNYFNHINYGTHFSELVSQYAEEFNFHPLFLFSVIAQESAFEGYVRSSAGARGLMQIIPSTGQTVAEKLIWPEGYTSEDLYRPFINLKLGTAYLNMNRTYYNGDLYAMLAAYNAGPGNANTWWELSGGDADLFLEIIRFPETQNYIRYIYEIQAVYRSLYGRLP